MLSSRLRLFSNVSGIRRERRAIPKLYLTLGHLNNGFQPTLGTDISIPTVVQSQSKNVLQHMPNERVTLRLQELLNRHPYCIRYLRLVDDQLFRCGPQKADDVEVRLAKRQSVAVPERQHRLEFRSYARLLPYLSGRCFTKGFAGVEHAPR